MNRIKKYSLAITLTITMMASLTSVAGSWKWWKPYQGPDKDILTLVIASNYTNSRLLADLIQSETKQPYILLPANDRGQIFFCPSRKKPSLVIAENDLKRFIKFLSPKQIIVLGNKLYVPEKFLGMIDKKQTVWIISNENWLKSAEAVGKMLDATNLANDFKRLSEKLGGGQLYKSTASTEVSTDDNTMGDTVLEPVDTEETVVLEDAAPDQEPVIVEDPADPDVGKIKEPTMLVPEKDPVLIQDSSPTPK